MFNAALQDDQWLMCIPATLGFDDLEVYFEDVSNLDQSINPANINNACRIEQDSVVL